MPYVLLGFRESNKMDILYLLIPLSVVLIFSSLAGFGGPSKVGSSRTSTLKVKRILKDS